MFVNEMSVQKFGRVDDEKSATILEKFTIFFTFWRYLAKCQIALKYCGLIMSDINIRYVQEVIYIASTLWKLAKISWTYSNHSHICDNLCLNLCSDCFLFKSILIFGHILYVL